MLPRSQPVLLSEEQHEGERGKSSLVFFYRATNTIRKALFSLGWSSQLYAILIISQRLCLQSHHMNLRGDGWKQTFIRGHGLNRAVLEDVNGGILEWMQDLMNAKKNSVCLKATLQRKVRHRIDT